MADTTTVFQSGNSQAVRLPKEFRFKSKTVEIFRRGDEVVLREKRVSIAELLASLPPLTAEDHQALDEMMAIIREPQPQQERDWGALFGPAPRSKQARSQRKPTAQPAPSAGKAAPRAAKTGPMPAAAKR